MFRSRKPTVGLALLAILGLVLAACSNTGGKNAAQGGAANVSVGHANTQHYTVAMITHAAPGDIFWDAIRNGGDAAAAKDNITLKYSNDIDPTKQAALITDAINSHVNGIAVTDPNPGALCPTIQKARQAGIPVVMLNAGADNWQQCGALSFYGQDELVSGIASGKKLASEGAKHVLCVLQAQGQIQLEDRCKGAVQGLGGEGTVTKLYVNGTDNASMLSTITAALTRDKTVDAVDALGPLVGLAAVQAVSTTHSNAKVYCWGLSSEVLAKIKSGAIMWAEDQQPYLQGYLSVDGLWLYLTNANIVGGGQLVATGPAFIDSSNVAQVAPGVARGTR